MRVFVTGASGYIGGAPEMRGDGTGGAGTRRVGLLVPALAFLWFYNGANFLAFKVSVEAVPALVIGALRFTVAGLLLLPLAAWRARRRGLPTGREVGAAALVGLVLLVGVQVLAIWARATCRPASRPCSARRHCSASR